MEDFVNYPLAKKLKEAGFSQDYGCYGCKFIYSNETTIIRISEIGAYDRDYYGEGLPCPSLCQALKWLREEKKIFIDVGISDHGFYYTVVSFGEWDKSFLQNDIIHYDYYGWKTYEEAALKGMLWALDNQI